MAQNVKVTPKNIAHVTITLSYNNINYRLGVKKAVYLWVQMMQLDMKELFLLENIVLFFCILIFGSAAESCLPLCLVFHFVRAKYSLDCPVVTLHLSGSLPRHNKSHMQIRMEVFRLFIRHPVAAVKGKGGGWLVFRLEKEISVQLRTECSIRYCSGRAGLLPTAKFWKRNDSIPPPPPPPPCVCRWARWGGNCEFFF